MAGSEQLEAYIGYKCQVFLTIQAHKPGLLALDRVAMSVCEEGRERILTGPCRCRRERLIAGTLLMSGISTCTPTRAG